MEESQMHYMLLLYTYFCSHSLLPRFVHRCFIINHSSFLCNNWHPLQTQRMLRCTLNIGFCWAAQIDLLVLISLLYIEIIFAFLSFGISVGELCIQPGIYTVNEPRYTLSKRQRFYIFKVWRKTVKRCKL